MAPIITSAFPFKRRNTLEWPKCPSVFITVIVTWPLRLGMEDCSDQRDIPNREGVLSREDVSDLLGMPPTGFPAVVAYICTDLPCRPKYFWYAHIVISGSLLMSFAYLKGENLSRSNTKILRERILARVAMSTTFYFMYCMHNTL